jgi:hypothetical protein
MDPKSSLLVFLSDKLKGADLAQAYDLVGELIDSCGGGAESGALDAAIRRRVRAGAAKMAEDAATQTADVLSRFPGMSRIRVG